MANGDPHIRRVVNATGETAGQTMLPIASAASFREHAIPRFEKNAADDVPKRSDGAIRAPFNAGVRQNTESQQPSLGKNSPQTRTSPLSRFVRIAIKAKGRILFINAADIVAVEARGNYVSLLHSSNSHMLRESISSMEEKLNLHGFVRIHRSVLVNAAFVEEIHPRSTGEYALRVRGGREFTVTRTYKNNLQLLAQLWIGMEGFASE